MGAKPHLLSRWSSHARSSITRSSQILPDAAQVAQIRGGQAGRPSRLGRRSDHRSTKRRPTGSTSGASTRTDKRSSIRVAPTGKSAASLSRCRAAASVSVPAPVAIKVAKTGKPRKPARPSRLDAPATRRRSIKSGRVSRSKVMPISAPPSPKRSPIAGRPKHWISQPIKRASPEKLDLRVQATRGTGKENVFVRKPLEHAARCNNEALGLQTEGSGTAVILGGPRCRDQGVCAARDLDLDLQLVAADHPAGRMKEIEMAGDTLGIEGALHRQRTVLPLADNPAASGARGDLELQAGVPAARVGRRDRDRPGRHSVSLDGRNPERAGEVQLGPLKNTSAPRSEAAGISPRRHRPRHGDFGHAPQGWRCRRSHAPAPIPPPSTGSPRRPVPPAPA